MGKSNEPSTPHIHSTGAFDIFQSTFFVFSSKIFSIFHFLLRLSPFKLYPLCLKKIQFMTMGNNTSLHDGNSPFGFK